MEQQTILQMIKNRLLRLVEIAREHKTPEPVISAMQELKEIVSSHIINFGKKITGREKTHNDIAKVMENCLVMDGDGKFLNPFRLKDEDFKPELFAKSLSREKRFWNQTQLSVAEHCVNMSLVVEKLYPEREDLIKWALFHEIFESYTGDLATPFKACLPEYGIAEDETLKKFANMLGISGEMPYEIHIVDKTMMITEACAYMPNKEYWLSLGKKIGIDKFGEELKPYGLDIIELRREPLGEQQAETVFARRWIECKLNLTQKLLDIVLPEQKAYLAGPSVFLEEAEKHLVEMQNIFEKKSGIKASTPFDNKIEMTKSKIDNAKKIRESNIELIRKSDFIVADINRFRGEEPDSGTAFEIGYAAAIGKKIILYREDCKKTQIEQSGKTCDSNGFIYEDFELPANLMFFGDKVKIVSNLDEAASAVKEIIMEEHLEICAKNGKALEFIRCQNPNICKIATMENQEAVAHIKDDVTKSLIQADIQFKNSVEPIEKNNVPKR